jgi:hypothetical protein
MLHKNLEPKKLPSSLEIVGYNSKGFERNCPSSQHVNKKAIIFMNERERELGIS